MDVLEEGRIAFYRRKGDRLLILLGDRLIVVGRKRLPNPRRREKFWAFVMEDLNTPAGLAVLWQTARSTSLNAAEKHSLIADFDRLFGFHLSATCGPGTGDAEP